MPSGKGLPRFLIIMETKLSFVADSPPLSVFVVVKLTGISLRTDPSGSNPTFHFPNGLKMHGTNVLLRYIGRVANWYGLKAYESGEVIIFKCMQLCGKYLEKRPVVVGRCLSIADIVIWSALAGTGQRWEISRKSKKYQNLRSGKASAAKSKEQQGCPTIKKCECGCFEKGKAVAIHLLKYVFLMLKSARDVCDLHQNQVVIFTLGTQKRPLNQYFARRHWGSSMKKLPILQIISQDLMEMALIRWGKANVDDTPREQMKKERMDGIEPKCRSNSVEENMKLWKEMILGSERVRSSEYHDCSAQYHRIREDMGVKKVDGWDDPCFPTVQGMVRRGLKVEALILFILEQGALKNLNLMEWDKLWTINKKIIDPVCPRHHAVIEERGVFLTLTIQGIRDMKFEEREDFLDVLNTCTKIEIPAVGDSDMRNLKCVEVLQLEKKGYY
ncbi:hypothetical protein Patl1_15309 [Pistacia atlantica]|uniref:Uncharacterized protein n=1 Tax=Pistacia atlantica TaxID=434234 RepID=A0ACC1B9H3_9ROSI|nr:hypothetical protein Patl1_15309 [Pistacia atlantica]